jgi:hypothetical protein
VKYASSLLCYYVIYETNLLETVLNTLDIGC